jgi:hypothetical protein
MAERKEDWQSRGFNVWGPNVRLDFRNPQLGLNGADVYTLYSYSDNKDVNVTGLTQGGIYKIYNDKAIEIVAGQKSPGGGIDINIISKAGDITITAEKNGSIRIRGKNITIDADETITLNAGKDINMRSGGKNVVQAQQVDVKGQTGNALPQGTSMGESAYGASPKAGTDVVQDYFSGGPTVKYSCNPPEGPVVTATETQESDDEDIFSKENTTLTGNETSGSFETGGAASGGTLAE